MRRSYLMFAILAIVLWIGCQRPPNNPSSSGPSAEVRLQAIPDPDSSKYERGQYSRIWENPFLIIRKDGIALVDLRNNEERILKPEEVLDALAKLPASTWPYGRVLAVQETMKGTEQERVDIRRNRAIVAGSLESAHVLIHWVSAQ
jgi:hypothetical protein